jgi:hypothetical protein
MQQDGFRVVADWLTGGGPGIDTSRECENKQGIP